MKRLPFLAPELPVIARPNCFAFSDRDDVKASQLALGSIGSKALLVLLTQLAMASCESSSLRYQPDASFQSDDSAPKPDASPQPDTFFGPDASFQADTFFQPDVAGQPVASPHPEPCRGDEFYYSDRACPYGAGPCIQHGDLWCYTRCDEGNPCVGVSSCGQIDLFNGSDYLQGKVQVCVGAIEAPIGGDCRDNGDCADQAKCVQSVSAACGDASTCLKLTCQL